VWRAVGTATFLIFPLKPRLAGELIEIYAYTAQDVIGKN
jgi:hypothetical protein